jgi:hypothetical protein
MTLLSSLVGMPRAPIFPYDGWGPRLVGRSGTRPPTAVPTVNASALVTTPAVAKTTFMVGKPSPARCYRSIRNATWYRWASALTEAFPASSFCTFRPTRRRRGLQPCLDSRAGRCGISWISGSMPCLGAARKAWPHRGLQRSAGIPNRPPRSRRAGCQKHRTPPGANLAGFSPTRRDGSESQKATTPETMKPLNCPPLRMSVSGKSLYF